MILVIRLNITDSFLFGSLFFLPSSPEILAVGLLSSIISQKKQKDHDVIGKFSFPFTSWSYFIRASNMVSYYLTKELDTMKNNIRRIAICAIAAAMLIAGIHASIVTQEEDQQIMLCDLDGDKVLD